MLGIRRMIGAGGGVVLVASVLTGTALGAVQRTALMPESAPAGTTFTMHVETTARWAGTEPQTLFLVPQLAFEQGPSTLHCDEVVGSTPLGSMTWRTGRVAFGAGTYDGFIGDATFVVPEVAIGPYVIGETIGAVGNGCHPYAAFTVVSAGLPDTAVARSDGWTGTPIALVALAVTASVVCHVSRRLATDRSSLRMTVRGGH